MTQDRSFIEQNRAATQRIRTLVDRLSDQEMQQPVGEHWTVAIALAHLAFWDRRVLLGLDRVERDGVSSIPQIDISVNDLSLPLWKAIPPRAAAQIAIETAAALDTRLEDYPPALLDKLYAHNHRWVVRALHRNEHLDEVEAALRK
ncbi:MAG: maleylpyruvate isomerase N-terminal domain-containing protein [Caldilineaceae bacterium]